MVSVPETGGQGGLDSWLDGIDRAPVNIISRLKSQDSSGPSVSSCFSRVHFVDPSRVLCSLTDLFSHLLSRKDASAQVLPHAVSLGRSVCPT